MTTDDVKAMVELVFKEAGLYRAQWYGPVDRVTPFGVYARVLGVWYHLGYDQFFTPFSAPWTQWTKIAVDDQIAYWMKKSKEEVENYLIASPGLRFQTGFKCECGACHTKNNNLHSRWCPAYKEFK
jgi:hypothetical protein